MLGKLWRQRRRVQFPQTSPRNTMRTLTRCRKQNWISSLTGTTSSLSAWPAEFAWNAPIHRSAFPSGKEEGVKIRAFCPCCLAWARHMPRTTGSSQGCSRPKWDPRKTLGATDHLSLPGTERRQGSQAAAVATWGYFCLAQTKVNNTSFPHMVSNHTHLGKRVSLF